MRETSAGQFLALDPEIPEISQHRKRDVLCIEEFTCESLNIFSRDFLDALHHLVESEKALEIKFLARQVGHTARGGFKPQHERTFEMIFGAAQFFNGNQIFLEIAQLPDDRIDDFT